jgi:3-deoxy-D-arabino-heptulosonate 7-phosphate (DAHP) synthase class II
VINDLKLKQKRVWIDEYTEQPNLAHIDTVRWIGKQIVVMVDRCGTEITESLEDVIEKTVPLSKLKKRK